MPEKNSEKTPIDIDATLHAADEVSNLLDTTIKDPFERYVVARLISILYEETWNFSLDPEFEVEVRKLAKRSQKKVDGD